jgi:hypothetical protein
MECDDGRKLLEHHHEVPWPNLAEITDLPENHVMDDEWM